MEEGRTRLWVILRHYQPTRRVLECPRRQQLAVPIKSCQVYFSPELSFINITWLAGHPGPAHLRPLLLPSTTLYTVLTLRTPLVALRIPNKKHKCSRACAPRERRVKRQSDRHIRRHRGRLISLRPQRSYPLGIWCETLVRYLASFHWLGAQALG